MTRADKSGLSGAGYSSLHSNRIPRRVQMGTGRNGESILEQLGQAEFKSSEPSDPPTVGVGGWEIFRFKAVSAGQMALELVYHRSWEDVEPSKTFSIQVAVNSSDRGSNQ